MEGWTTESVLKKHNLWRELAGPQAGPTAITLQWQDMRIAKLEEALRAAQPWLFDDGGSRLRDEKTAQLVNDALLTAADTGTEP
jgi:hypothetical protein